MPKLSMVTLSWNRPASLLENSLWTLTHQSRPPDEIIVVEASPEPGWHDETKRVARFYPPTRVVDAHWTRFNVSRGINVGIRRTSEDSDYVACFGMELLFSENFVEKLMEKVCPDCYVRAACGSLWFDTKPESDKGAEHIRSNWDWFLSKVYNQPVPVAYGAVLCASRHWWHEVRGYDEARRPYSYPDIDLLDRARRYGLTETAVTWEEAQVLHPFHPISSLFYDVSGYPVDASGVDARLWRNESGWGEVEGDEPIRIPKK